MKKFLKMAAVAAAICAALSFASCGDDDDDEGGSAAEIKTLGIAGAKELYITGGSAGRSARAAGDTQKIFKITEDGYAEEVKYYDEDGNETTTTLQPTAIYPVNDDYICVGFGYSSNSVTSAYLVRKSDGAVFDMKNAGVPYVSNGGGFKNENPFKTDKNSNLYYLAAVSSGSLYYTKIVKVDLGGIYSLSGTDFSPATDYVYNFAVDKNGNVIYTGYLTSDSSNRICRIKKSGGGLANIDLDYDPFWIGLDGNIYYYNSSDYSYSSENSTWTYTCPIKKLEFSDSGVKTESVYGNFSEWASFYPSSTYKLSLQDRIIMIYSLLSNSKVYEVYNPTSSPRVVSFSDFSIKSVTAVASTEDFYYIAGTDSSSNTFLVKIDPQTDSVTKLLQDNEYDVYAFTASETDGITFNALRMSDGKKIIGKVGIDGGAVKVIDEESDAEVVCLERIN